jgi:hypothetical protein
MADWTQFKLTITNPPAASNHFELIKKYLVPFVTEKTLPFWVTNYRDANSDFILFRVKCALDKSTFVQEYLNTLKEKKLIFDWSSSEWSPATDASNRIKNLARIGFDPNANMIVDFLGGNIVIAPDANIQEREKQLTALFESVGECTKAVYTHLETKPKDLWVVSLFIHLLLNSMDYSGPNAGSDEEKIRRIPAV